MASLKVGRILDWNALGNIPELTVTSTDISIRGLINQPNDINKAKAVRDQLVGLANNQD